jgi:very-short-patch-repair endonuclease
MFCTRCDKKIPENWTDKQCEKCHKKAEYYRKLQLAIKKICSGIRKDNTKCTYGVFKDTEYCKRHAYLAEVNMETAVKCATCKLYFNGDDDYKTCKKCRDTGKQNRIDNPIEKEPCRYFTKQGKECPYGALNCKTYCQQHHGEFVRQLQQCLDIPYDIRRCSSKYCMNIINKNGGLCDICLNKSRDYDLKSTRKHCKYDKCTTIASFNYSDCTVPFYCLEHKYENMVNIIIDKCTNCEFRYQNYIKICPKCKHNKHQFKDNEQLVKKYFDENHMDYKYNYYLSINKQKYCVDFLFTYDTHYLIVECDEAQHKTNKYVNEDVERQREKIISDNVGLPCKFIRFNPSPYRNNGKIIKISKNNRFKQLLNTIKKWGKEPLNSDNYTEVMFLYYDDNHNKLITQ